MCLVNKKNSRLCSFFDIEFSIVVAASLQLLQLSVALTFYKWKFAPIPAFYVMLTMLAICLRGSRNFRIFVFWSNLVHGIVSLPGFIVYMVYVEKMDIPREDCKDGIKYADGRVELDNCIYPSMGACINSFTFWYYFGFAFYFVIVLPSTITYLEIFYYWMKALSPINTSVTDASATHQQTRQPSNKKPLNSD